jgi:putative RNA 2'-phosphotransferase
VDPKRVIKVSKYLSRHLRHDPGRLGLTLAPGGWVSVEALLKACAAHSFALTREELVEVVASNDKHRFSFDETGTRIRANQGHSVAIDLGLEPTAPPSILFHGTGEGSVDSIMRTGLERRRRHHVHLSGDDATAVRVGSRHGKPVVLQVDAKRMARDGHAFYLTENGVWLTFEVPAAYLTRAR